MRRAMTVLLMAVPVVMAGVAALNGAEPARPPAAPPQVPAAAPQFQPCAWGGIAGRVECATLRVPEDRARPSARSLSLFFLVVRATERSTSEPIFFFTGGPGSAASRSAGFLSAEFAQLRVTRDFVFIDQRGTGRSAPLACDVAEDSAGSLRPMFDAADAEACRKKLSASADLRLYTTSDAVLDVEDVRRTMGYARINLHGSSYGTRAAWAYAAQFPSRTRAMLLQGPAPPGFYLPVPFARGLDTAIDGIVEACAREAACAARFPALRADTAKAFARLRAKPARVGVGGGNAPTGPGGANAPTREGAQNAAMRDVDFTYGELAEALRYQLYAVQSARRVPFLLSRAAAGDYTPLAQAAVFNRARLQEQLARGMFMSVTCAEDVPFMDAATIRAATAGTRMGDYRVRQQIAACDTWPRGESRWWGGPTRPRTPAPPRTSAPASAPTPAPIPLRTPALVQVGEFDPATPLFMARRALQLLPNGKLIVVPHGAHSFAGLSIDDCMRRLNNAFFTRGTTRNLDTSCVAAARRPPFALQ